MGEPSTAFALALQVIPFGAVEVQFCRVVPPTGLRVWRLTNGSFLFVFHGLQITVRDFVQPFTGEPEEAILQLQLFSETFPSIASFIGNRSPESQ